MLSAYTITDLLCYFIIITVTDFHIVSFYYNYVMHNNNQFFNTYLCHLSSFTDCHFLDYFEKFASTPPCCTFLTLFFNICINV